MDWTIIPIIGFALGFALFLIGFFRFMLLLLDWPMKSSNKLYVFAACTGVALIIISLAILSHYNIPIPFTD